MPEAIPRHIRALSAALVLILWPLGPASAQEATSEEALDAIIGSEVQEEEARAETDADRVIAAIEKTEESTSRVRKTTTLDKVDIVFLPDAAVTEGGPPPEIETKIEEHKEAIEQLREELEGNAMLYHAIDSRQILVRDVLAVEFPGDDSIVIYAAAKPVE